MILQVLSHYQEASGQQVNLDKTKVSFRMRVKTIQSHMKYLGLPVLFGRSKKEIFSIVVNRVWKKLKGWKEGVVSRAGKEVLIKAVVQAIPTYMMSCFELLEGVCNDLESLMEKFWWGSQDENHKIHWTSWENLPVANGEGGMGFRGVFRFSCESFGETLLAH